MRYYRCRFEPRLYIRLVLADALREAGFRVLEAGKADDVVTMLNAIRVDVVVTNPTYGDGG
jgi:hypothetical protein